MLRLLSGFLVATAAAATAATAATSAAAPLAATPGFQQAQDLLQGDTRWQQVAIGGGGYVLQTFFHPTSKHVYMKTDVGGVYRREPSADAPGGFLWVPLLDWAGPSNSSDYSVSALAMRPDTGAGLMLLTGGYWAYSNCSVLISSTAGDSWSVAPGSRGWGLTCGGNEGDRAVGDRMSVHPKLPRTVAVGGSDGGVWITTDAFATTLPTRVTLPSPAAAAGCNPGKDKNSSCVVRSVAWLEVAGKTLLLAAVPSHGLFASAGPDYADSTSWSFVTDSDRPTNINRIDLSSSAAQIWATAGGHTDPVSHLTTGGGVWSGVLQPAGALGWKVTWNVVGALAAVGLPFSGIASRDGGRDIVAMTFSSNNNQSIWRSLDAGTSFHQVNWTCTSSVPWWGQDDYNTKLNAGSSLAFDPNSPTIWATDFFGVYSAPIASTRTPLLEFQNVETGHEEVCINTVKAPAVGDLLTGAADVGGWRHDKGTSTWPSATFKAADGWAHNCVFSIDATLSLSPSKASADTVWVTAGDEYGACHGSPKWCGLHSWIGVSRDGGATFEDTTWDDHYPVDQANPYRVAVHPFNGAKAVVAARKGLPLSFTSDYGALHC
eukprot:COSAG03_NODE_288_length_9356_cov_6.131224_8_plen_602_part_00